MGLFDLDGVEEGNERGRPEKKGIKETEKVDGCEVCGVELVHVIDDEVVEAYNHNEENKERIEEEFNKLKKQMESITEVIETLSHKFGIHPIYMRKKLNHFGIYSTDWEEYIENHPLLENDGRIPINQNTQKSSSSTSFLEESDDSGLAGLVKDAK